MSYMNIYCVCVCIYVCTFLCAEGKCCKPKSRFLPPLCFSESIIYLCHFFFIPLSLFTPHSCRKCNHVQGAASRESEGSCEKGQGETLKRMWGRERKRHLYVYPITTPASPKSPSQGTDAHALSK